MTASLNKLDKVLALVDSNHDGEATGALRLARNILARDGLSFSDLARVAVTEDKNLSPTERSIRERSLENKVDYLTQENRWRAAQMAMSQRCIVELEEKLQKQKAEAERWREVARETVESLWDNIRDIQKKSEALPEHQPAPKSLSSNGKQYRNRDS